MAAPIESHLALGQWILAALSICSVVLLAYWRIVDGAAAIATILAVTGVTGSANAAVHSRSQQP